MLLLFRAQLSLGFSWSVLLLWLIDFPKIKLLLEITNDIPQLFSAVPVTHNLFSASPEQACHVILVQALTPSTAFPAPPRLPMCAVYRNEGKITPPLSLMDLLEICFRPPTPQKK